MLSIAELREFAASRHGEQRYGEVGYVIHLDEVYQVTCEFGLGETYQRAAYGHDLIDDTGTSRTEVREIFGQEEELLINSVSGHGSNRTHRRADTITRLLAYPPGSNLKAADRIANIRRALAETNLRMLGMYLGEADEYSVVFAHADPALRAEIARLYEVARQAMPSR